MDIELVHIGFNNFLATNRIVAVASINSTCIKHAIKEAESRGLLIDMTHGRKTRAAIVTDTGQIFLSSRASEIIAGRLQTSRDHTERGDSPIEPESSDEKASP